MSDISLVYHYIRPPALRTSLQQRHNVICNKMFKMARSQLKYRNQDHVIVQLLENGWKTQIKYHPEYLRGYMEENIDILMRPNIYIYVLEGEEKRKIIFI